MSSLADANELPPVPTALQRCASRNSRLSDVNPCLIVFEAMSVPATSRLHAWRQHSPKRVVAQSRRDVVPQRPSVPAGRNSAAKTAILIVCRPCPKSRLIAAVIFLRIRRGSLETNAPNLSTIPSKFSVSSRPDVRCYQVAVTTIVPDRSNWAISSAVRPISFNTSRVCCPICGGLWRFCSRCPSIATGNNGVLARRPSVN
jgi:hypothetical protein